MIIVTGATGKLNGAVVDHLLKRVPASQIGVSVRDPNRAQHLADQGIRVRQGSYDDPAALLESFEGADQVLLISSSDLTADVAAQHRRAVDAAVEAGAQHILYTSQHAAALDSPYSPQTIHAMTEDYLAASGVAWTALRYGFYGTIADLVGPWQSTGTIVRPVDGPFFWVDRRDAGEAAAEVLTRGAAFNGPVDLTPTSPVTLSDFATAASALAGRHIDRIVVDDEEWIDQEIASGVPEPAARFTLSMFQATRIGHFAHAHPKLTELLGRDPRSIAVQMGEEIVADNRAR
ncbi:NmrA family NAD(P)-binding protein [Brevibacterium oceani]|uniref:NmrA family NAD(P)-binding protein n=1 Tax=Brevibacterium oceani TaxID=358099 RepID=UPI0015E632F4|nr:NAD(P)H-binding protein [Brevibacterium oceani]